MVWQIHSIGLLCHTLLSAHMPTNISISCRKFVFVLFFYVYIFYSIIVLCLFIFSSHLDVFVGIVLCLVFNVVAVTVCWIRGGGELIQLLSWYCQSSSFMPCLGPDCEVYNVQVLKYFSLQWFMRCLGFPFHTCFGTGPSIVLWGKLQLFLCLFTSTSAQCKL